MMYLYHAIAIAVVLVLLAVLLPLVVAVPSIIITLLYVGALLAAVYAVYLFITGHRSRL